MAQDSAVGEGGRNTVCPLVAVGASAGGLQAFESFLAELPREFPFPVIFVQHLSPSHKSLMPELLRNQRPDIGCEVITDGLGVFPGTVYLYPPAHSVTIRNGVFHVNPDHEAHRRLPIDAFLCALAEEQGDLVIAVILSGAGSDGARGVQAVKAAGGMVFVQDPATAEFSAMPQAAIATGQVDKVLSAGEIARQIMKLSVPGEPCAFSDSLLDEVPFELFFRLLYDKTGHRFEHYKKNVVARRIRRRITLLGISSFSQYLQLLATDAAEAELIALDMMIGVTSFFRDRLVWTALNAEVIRPLIRRHDDSPIRIWTPACATGEEAYSIAMMLLDELGISGRRLELQVFASDVNDRALERARAGVYPESVTEDIPPEYAKKYLAQSTDGQTVAVSGDIRQHIVFTRHDVLTDPPFSRMDLIICRNMMIYLEPAAQDKCISLFHYALKDGGCLFLGSAESVGNGTTVFEAVGNKKNRIYRKIAGTVPMKRHAPVSFPSRAVESVLTRRSAVQDQRASIADIAQKALIEECGMAAVAIDQNYDILYYSGPMNRYLRNPEGGPTQNLLELLPDTLRSRIRGSLYRILRDEKPVSIRSTIPLEGGRKREVTLRMSILNEGGFFLVTFREKSAPVKVEEQALDGALLHETAVRQLESELCSTREDLQSHIEQLESLGEELQSSNEELQASNEELETSQEELQSLNEELLTVNAQLQTKIEELDETNNDLTNFIASTDIPTLFLDRHRVIRRFTPAMTRLIPLVPADIGRPISDLSQSRLGPDLIADAQKVLDTEKPVWREIGIDGFWYERFTLPYKTGEVRTDGVVITYRDFTERKQSEDAVRESEELYRSLFTNMLNGFAYCRMIFDGDRPHDFEYLVVNEAFPRLTGLQDVVGKRVSEVIPGIQESDPALFQIFGRVVVTGIPERFETYVEAMKMWYSISAYRPKEGHFVVVFDEITERKQAEETLRASEARYRELVQNANSAIIRWRADGAITFFNEYAQAFFGYNAEDAIGRHVGMLLPERESTGGDLSGLIEDIVGHPERYAYNVNENICRDGRRVWMSWTNKPIFDSDGKVSEILAVGTDITARKQAEASLRESEERLRLFIEHSPASLAMFDRSMRYLYVSRRWRQEYNLGDRPLSGVSHYEVFPEIGEAWKEAHRRGLSGEVLRSDGDRFERADGSVQWIRWEIRPWSDAAGTVGGIVIFSEDITAGKQSEELLRESREKISLVLNSTAEGIYGLDSEGNCTFCNPSGVSMLGYRDEQELIGRNMHELIHHTRADGAAFPREECPASKVLKSGEHIHLDREILWRADGTSFPAEFWTHPIYKDTTLIGTVVTFVDISERVELEKQLIQSQKMEAVGQLAGGIAHDFNNNLSAIIGFAHLLQMRMPADDPMRADAEQIIESANRAAEVTRSLLAFSRQQVMNPKVVDLNELIRNFRKLIARLIGEDIELVVSLSPEPVRCVADPVQIEQVLMNLATNARDAMPRGGALTISTALRYVESAVVADTEEIRPGNYVVLSVTDSGSGMSQETLAKIFEPFFTTKEVGRGTGLGLSMVYGIVKQHDGYIGVESAPGKGTAFSLYFPATLISAADAARMEAAGHPVGGTEMLMIAEDDDTLRRLYGVMFTQNGYRVVLAADGEEAVSRFAEHRDEIRLVLMDMIMPKKSGMEAFAEIRGMKPDVKVVFLSGYTADRLDDATLGGEGVSLLTKPVMPPELLRKVREALDQ